MSLERKRELLDRIEAVARGDSRFEVQQEQNVSASQQRGFLWLK